MNSTTNEIWPDKLYDVVKPDNVSEGGQGRGGGITIALAWVGGGCWWQVSGLGIGAKLMHAAYLIIINKLWCHGVVTVMFLYTL